jgi:hypothetical protein
LFPSKQNQPKYLIATKVLNFPFHKIISCNSEKNLIQGRNEGLALLTGAKNSNSQFFPKKAAFFWARFHTIKELVPLRKKRLLLTRGLAQRTGEKNSFFLQTANGSSHGRYFHITPSKNAINAISIAIFE